MGGFLARLPLMVQKKCGFILGVLGQIQKKVKMSSKFGPKIQLIFDNQAYWGKFHGPYSWDTYQGFGKSKKQSSHEISNFELDVILHV